MTYASYFIIRQIAMSILLFLGMNMLLIKLPAEVKKSLYQRSLRVMGVAFLIVPLSCFIYTQKNKLDSVPYISTAISLTAYASTFLLMATAFLKLLGRRYSKPLMVGTFLAIFIYPLPLWTSIMLGDVEVIDTVITASYTYFVLVIILLSGAILHRHHSLTNNFDNYFSDDIHICVSWISKSIWLLIGLTFTCLLAPIFFIYPLWLRCIFMCYGVFCYIYIYYGYRRMLINLSTNAYGINIATIEGKSDFDNIMSAEVVTHIEDQLDIWLSNGNYLRKGITINDVAKEIKSNRTYLSKYINSTYHCTFKTWITTLRIEEAKRLMQNSPNLSISDIASRAGFASIESFSHIFARSEHCSPSKWRESAHLAEEPQPLR